ncbi:MAG: hypothetical protein PUB86_07570 [Elusimicrobia bacterium]|nr:hypothetical protein [Elusimicrobiota bacterium]
MNKFLPVIIMPLLICGCVGMSTTDGDSTKQWITIVSSKSDLDGSTADVCYKLNLRFNPEEAEDRIDTDKACITRCCWYSENKLVQMDLNEGFAEELVQNGTAKKYDPELLTIRISYSPFLKTIHGKADQKGVLKSDGLVQLDYDQVTRPEQFLDLDFGTQTPKQYEDTNIYEGSYLFTKQKNDAEAKAKEQIAQANQVRAAQAAEEKVSEKTKAAEQASSGDLDEAERQELLQKKLSYERRQAVLLVKRFYGKEIDSYILAIDKAKRAQGLVLMSNDRDWTTVKTGTPIYKVTCKVNGKLGKTASTMKNFPISCGSYEVDLDEKTVNPIDTAARSIVNGEYIN